MSTSQVASREINLPQLFAQAEEGLLLDCPLPIYSTDKLIKETWGERKECSYRLQYSKKKYYLGISHKQQAVTIAFFGNMSLNLDTLEKYRKPDHQTHCPHRESTYKIPGDYKLHFYSHCGEVYQIILSGVFDEEDIDRIRCVHAHIL